MNIINITDFKQNIGTYFDELISNKKPLYIQRRKHSAMILPLDDFTDEEIEIIENMRLSKNNMQVEVKDKEWVETFNKIS
jgi:PHD/YefM family antitoxin component YafN of YafNO toxin-antitoxin module